MEALDAKHLYKQCFHKTLNMHFKALVKVLCSFSVAPYIGDTMKTMEAKRLYKPPPSMFNTIFYEPTFCSRE